MKGKKYGNFLTVILVIVIIITIVLIGKLVYDIWDKKNIRDSAEEAIAEFDQKIKDADKSSDNNINKINATEIKIDTENFTYGGYNMMGYIEIPAIDIKYPVLEKVTTRSIEIAVAILEGVGLNEIGNTIIVGHNYRNGVFFSRLDELEINDVIYITDRSGTKIKYKAYNIFSTTPEDSEFFDRDTEGKREITLETCSDTGGMRIVVFAREVIEEDEKKNTNVTTNQQINGIISNIVTNENTNATTNSNIITNYNENDMITINRTKIGN